MIGYKFTDATPPYKSRDIKPLAKVDITQTPYTVPSLGLNISRYTLDDNAEPDFDSLSNLTLVDSGTSPLVGFFYGGGSPPGFSTINRFAYKYTGYFFCQYPSDSRTSGWKNLPWNFNAVGDYPFTFSAIGYGHIRVKIGSTYIIGASGYEALTPTVYTEGSINLEAGTWYAIEILYYSDTDESGLAVLWKNNYFWGDDSDKFNFGVPISAGVTSTTEGFLSVATLPGVEKVQISQGINEASTLQFDLPLNTANGYYYDRIGDKYIYSGDTDIQLKSRWLIEGYIGFVNSSESNEYVKRFTGIVTEISPRRAKDTDVITVKCTGFEEFLNTAINLNYPDKFDYWAAGYAGSEYGFDHPDGVDMPVTYDGWELTKVVQSLMIRAYIDPSLFLEKKYYLNNAGESVPGHLLIERASPEFVVLDKGRNYGEPFATVEEDQVVDTSYVIQSNFGDILTDYLNKIVDIYGWDWGFSGYHNGAPYLKPKNNPVETKYLSDATFTGTWNDAVYDIDAVNGEYRTTDEAGAYVQFAFKGKRIELIAALAGTAITSGATTRVAEGSTASAVVVEDATGFSAGDILVIQFDETHEYSTIDSIASNTITVDPAFEKIPVVGSFARTASYSAEVRRGTDWASGVSVTTTYQSNHWDSTDHQSSPRVGWNQAQDPVGPIAGLVDRRLYYQGIDPRIARNPCIHLIASGLSYDDYLLRVTQTSGRVGVNALFVYSDDPLTPVDTFRTGDNVEVGTVVELGLEDAVRDQRNDTIVVGRRIGAEVAGIEDRTVNPNNPYYRHILSRAVDIGSIYDSTTQNFVGRPLQTIQIAPELSSQSRVDHWAIAFINRYRFPGRFPSYAAITNPLIEPGDCISIDDEGKSLVKYYDRAWVESISTNVSKTEIMDRIKTTTYAPWESFVPRKQFDSLANFGNLAIQNLTIKESATGETITTNNPYDPYSSQEDNNFVEITYDLNVSGNVRIDIYNSSSLRVATLLNVATEAEEDLGWLHQDIGKNYKVIWDGVDMFGDHNTFAGLGQEVADPKKFYVAERGGAPYETFFVKFTIKQDNGKLHFLNSKGNFGDPNQYIYTLRGNPVTLKDDLTIVSPAYAPDGSAISWFPSITYTDTKQFGFFGNSNVDGNSNPAGLAVYFAVDGIRPVIALVDITTYLLGASVIKLKGTIVPKKVKTFVKFFSAEIKEPTLRISTTFKDFSKQYKLNFNPLNFGYPFWDTGESYYDIEELRSNRGVSGDSEYNAYEAFPIAAGWYFKILVTIFDASGRQDTKLFYARWCGEDSTDDQYKRFVTVEYLDDVWPAPSLPTNQQIAEAWAWTDEDDIGFTGESSHFINIQGKTTPTAGFKIPMNYKFPG
jgi:hypothetical protein